MTKKILPIVAALFTASALLAGCDTTQHEGMDHGGMGGMNGGMMNGDMHMHMWENVTHAVAVLEPTAGNNVRGTLQFDQMGDHVHVSGQVTGLAPNSTHGFHIHEFGDVSSTDGSAAGGHYNPEGAAHQHADVNTTNSHAGDMGNITADANGVAKVDIHLQGVSIAGMKDPIIGRGVVVHASADDLKSQPAGNAGPRVAVGVIGVKKNP